MEQNEKVALDKMSKKKRVVSIGTKSRRGRPPKTEKVVAQNTIQEKKQSKKGYKLSNWDEWVISGISQKGKPQITQEIVDSVKAMTQETGVTTTDEEIRNKVIRSLQKLANRRGDLVKVPYKGKGYAYAIPGMAGAKRKIAKKSKKK